MTDMEQETMATLPEECREEFELFKNKFNEWRKTHAALIVSDETYFIDTEMITSDKKRLVELVIMQTLHNCVDWTLFASLKKFFEDLTQEHTFTKITPTHTVKMRRTDTIPQTFY
jgi:hypothetical protein